MNSLLMKLALAVVLAGFLASCAGAPSSPRAGQADDHIVQGGSFTGKGMLYFPVGSTTAKK